MKHHLLNGYYVHIANVGMEAETMFLLWWDVVCRRAKGSSTGASDPFGHDIVSVRGKARSRNSYITPEVHIVSMARDRGFILLFSVIRIRPLLTIMPFGSYLKISYFVTHRSAGLSLQI